MPVYVVVPQPHSNAGRLPAAVREMFADSIYELEADKGWLVVANLTAKDLAERLGVTSGTNGAAVILEVASYFGRANPNVWTWLKAKLEGSPGG